MADIICPICKRVNDDSAERCWYCQAVLNPVSTPQNSDDADWLASLRGESKDNETPNNSEDNNQDTPSDKDNEEEVPDWLARIRTREQIEREAQQSDPPVEPEEDKESNLPDWLKEIKSGDSIAGSKNAATSLESKAENQPPLIDPSTFLDAESGGMGNEEDNETWLNRLAAWKPELTSETVKNEFAVKDTKASDQPNLDNPIGESPETQEILETPADQIDEMADANDLATAALSSTPTAEMHQDEEPTATPPDSDENKLVESPFDLPISSEVPGVSGDESDIFYTPTDLTSEPVDQPEAAEPVIDSLSSDAFPEDLSEFTPISSDDEIFASPVEQNEQIDEPAETLETPVEQSGSPTIFSNDLPDWLSSTSSSSPDKQPTSIPKEESINPETIDENIELAKLPAWLQAMRPIESVSTNALIDETTDEADTEGLLAGIEGAIQSKPSIEPLRKSNSYGSGLKVSEKQRNNANLLTSLLEPVPVEVLSETVKNNQIKYVMYRLGVGIILIALAFVGNWLFSGMAVTPVLYPPEVVTVFDGVNALPVEKPILLAGDFEASLSGELMWSSRSFIDHLMRRNIKMTILSSNPVSSAILYKQIKDANLDFPAYQETLNVIDLGYLPGGTVGIRSLVTDLRSALPFKLNLQSAWDNPILQNVNSLNDFGAVVIFTEKAENARNWIEQLQPNLTGTPIYFIVSAQAAPMIQPYFQSGQVSGYIAGLNGSLAYEQILQQPGVSINHLGAYQLVVLAVAITLLFGGLLSLVRPIEAGKKE